MENNNKPGEIDENLYSRQLYAIGHDAMQKMSEASVLICGLGGLGVEVAKNTILSGFKSVTLYDNENVKMSDLSSQYYFSSRDVGRNRVLSCYQKLAELNPYVKVQVHKGDLSEDFLKDFSVIVLTESLLGDQLDINKFTHENNIAFINAITLGLVGQIFCDFGKDFQISDSDGEQPYTSIIESLSSEDDSTTLVTCVESKPHGLTSGDFIKFVDVQFNGKLNNTVNSVDKLEVQYVNKNSFRIKYDVSELGNFTGGEFVQVKVGKTLDFLSLQESVKNPEFVITNYSDFDRPVVLHACYLAYNEHKLKTGCDPESFNNFFRDVQKYMTDQTEVSNTNEETARKFFHCLNGNLCPMNAIIGGTVAQEILKACSGKFNPIHQWLYFDAFECLPDNYEKLNTDISSNSTRYDGQVTVFGREFQEKLGKQSWFVVGSGAIGCELLKNVGMIGLSTDTDAKLYITDMDTIEKSNLNRQFLFRNKDIGSCKSVVASKAISVMNSDINIEAHQNRVGSETEHVYSNKFFEEIDGVLNALDNVDARLYMDNQCVNHKKHLLESGTLGTKGNTQVIIPDVTESYGSSRDPPEESIPVCTIKNFPNEIAHTIQWTRDQFEGLFNQDPKNALEYIRNPEKIKCLPPSDIINMAGSINNVLNNIPTNFNDCVVWAFKLWHDNYRDQIEQLLYKFPSDHQTSSGVNFWSGAKKCPHAITFDPTNEHHLNYVWATANLWSNVFGCEYTEDEKSKESVRLLVSRMKAPELTIDRYAHISVTDDEEKAKQKDKIEALCLNIDDILASLPDPSVHEHLTIVPQDFEKDDDSNFHIDFVTTSSNMRALNYDIPPASNHKTKGIAGKIIPALATTTSVVAGLVTLELYKVVQGFTDVERYNNGFINLALPFFGFSDPIEAPVTTLGDLKFTMWDKFEVKEDMKLQEFLDHFEREHKLDLDFVNYNSFTIYSLFVPPKKLNQRLNMTIKDIIEEGLDTKLDTDMIILTIGGDQIDSTVESEENDIELPQVKYYL
jgi:ubiquitin-activating enzyme E1